jgi:transcriptional regulator with XRE-family HTH domain
MGFPERLNHVRKGKGYTAQRMADVMGVTIRTYRNWESGHSYPSLEALVRLADIFDVSTDYLLCRDGFLARCADGFQTDLP